jgi:hypothetical protein
MSATVRTVRHGELGGRGLNRTGHGAINACETGSYGMRSEPNLRAR